MRPGTKEMLKTIHHFIQTQEGGDELWDILTALRGPDSPSERPDMNGDEARQAYLGRRERKYRTVEVIRGVAMGQCSGARWHRDTKVVLPPAVKWDHFDKHVARAAAALGLTIETREV
jgi:hypothetical protein